MTMRNALYKESYAGALHVTGLFGKGWTSTIFPLMTLAIISVSNGFTLDTRPSPQLANAPIEQFSTMSPGLVITFK